VIRPNPVTIQLRYLQALSEISSNQGSTIVFPLPIDLIRPLLDAGGGDAEPEEADSAQLRLTTGNEEQVPAALSRAELGHNGPGEPHGSERRLSPPETD
jgi:hypothetical protein